MRDVSGAGAMGVDSATYSPNTTVGALKLIHTKKTAKFLFPGLFFYDNIESPNPKKKPRRHHTTGHKPFNWRPNKLNPRPQTTINEQKCKKSIKNNLGNKCSKKTTVRGSSIGFA